MARRIIIFGLLFSFVYTPLVFIVVDGIMKLPSIALTIDSGPLSYPRAAIIFIALVVPVAVFMYLDIRTPPWKKAVLAGGQRARGVVRKIESTGTAKNNVYYLRLILEVQPHGQAPFEAKFELPEFRVSQLSPGDKLHVKYDPQNKRHIAIEEFEAAKRKLLS